MIGYRAMWQRLRDDHGLVVSRETVRMVLHLIDPEGVDERRRHKLKRRNYSNPGPNHVWHIDGYDKLKPFGLRIHGCIDGYRRRILWLEVGKSHNDPAVVAKYFLDYIQKISGVPHLVHADGGTENVHVAGIQRYFRRHGEDDFGGDKSFLPGKSTTNQRIEAWWSILRKGCTGWWINHFKDLRDEGLYSDGNVLHRECLRYLYMPLLRDELYRVARLWNNHKLRPDRNREGPDGKPDILYFVPEAREVSDMLISLEIEDINAVKDITKQAWETDLSDCTAEFTRLATIIMNEHGWQFQQSPEEAKTLYIRLTREMAIMQ